MSDPVLFERSPEAYVHWKLALEAPVATLSMAVQEDRPLNEGYALKLNSYDLGVDIELADAIERLRFEHPEIKVVVITSVLDRMFCAGANIRMLGSSSHPFKVNFCKFTNETRLYLEEAAECSGLKTLAAVNGIAAGGGYELALACEEILLVDDGASVVSLPEVPLLGVLPGTGGLTRVSDKRKVRRDLADVFCSSQDGIKGQRAVDYGLVDAIAPRSSFVEAVQARAMALAAGSDRPGPEGAQDPGLGQGILLTPLAPKQLGDELVYRYVTLKLDASARVATLSVRGPSSADEAPASIEDFLAAGDSSWSLRAFRELDDALLRLRLNALEIGTLLLKTEGDPDAVLAHDAFVVKHHSHHWAVRELLLKQKRVLKRLDIMSRSTLAVVEPGSCFAGSLAELLFAVDRSYMLDDPERPCEIRLSEMNSGLLPMGNGQSRLWTRFLGAPTKVETLLAHQGSFDAAAALSQGLVTFAPDDIDWEDELRLAIEERVAISPDALTGMEANLRFAGPETMETKIFGRLSAWQNWIFQRPNAVGEKGALTLYGAGERPHFDLRRT